MDGKKLRYTVPLSEKLHVNFFLMVFVQLQLLLCKKLIYCIVQQAWNVFSKI